MSRQARRAWMVTSWAAAASILATGTSIAYYRSDSLAKERALELNRIKVLYVEASTAKAEAMAKNAEADAKLKEAEYRLREIARQEAAVDEIRTQVNHGWAKLDFTGHVLEWNKAMERFTGYTREEMLGQTLGSIMSSNLYERHTTALRARMTDPKTWRTVTTVKCAIKHKDPAREPREYQVTIRILPTEKDPDHPNILALVNRAENVVDLSAF